MAQLLAVCIGRPEFLDGKRTPTGIFKHPASHPVAITAEGVSGDAVLDRKHHGGPDQAVYLYLQSDYAWWADQTGERFAPGTFGENLLIAGVDNDTLAIGDRFAIGDVLLEVTSHRAPCSTLAKRLGDPAWVKRFQQAGRPGAYLRVLHEGSVAAGDAVDYRPFPGERVRVADLMAPDGVRTILPETLHRVLATPVHFKMRRDFETRLSAGGSVS